MDDEESILTTTSAILDKIGYRVISSLSGARALEIFKERYADISLVMLDMIMPGMSGDETFFEMKKIQPDVNVLLTSGIINDKRVENLLKAGILGILQKPYTINELIGTLENLKKRE